MQMAHTPQAASETKGSTIAAVNIYTHPFLVRQLRSLTDGKRLIMGSIHLNNLKF